MDETSFMWEKKKGQNNNPFLSRTVEKNVSFLLLLPFFDYFSFYGETKFVFITC